MLMQLVASRLSSGLVGWLWYVEEPLITLIGIPIVIIVMPPEREGERQKSHHSANFLCHEPQIPYTGRRHLGFAKIRADDAAEASRWSGYSAVVGPASLFRGSMHRLATALLDIALLLTGLVGRTSCVHREYACQRLPLFWPAEDQAELQGPGTLSLSM